MAVPAVALANQVTAIHANTLYAFQPDAFQSIDLSPSAQWKTLPMGVSTNGSQAVSAQSGGQDVLFTVGGRTDAAHDSFLGLQAYNYAKNEWQALVPKTTVAQNRVQHGAAWLQSTNSILVFGGSQDNSYRPTAETYTIGTEPPYFEKSYGPGAPAVQNPILLPYNASHALMAGGGANQDQIWTFSEADGWIMMTSTIQGGIADASKVQGALTTDAQGAKQLQLFDMSQSPNKVTTVSLSNQFHKRGLSNSAERRDASGAPTAVRSGFSLAQDPASNLVVITGGTSDKAAGPLAVFNQAKSSWQDASSIPGAQPASGSTSGATGSAPAANLLVASPNTAQSSQSASSAVTGASSAATQQSALPSSHASDASQSVSSGVTSSVATGTSATATGTAASVSASASGSSTAQASATSAGASSSANAASAAASSSVAAAGGASSNSTSVILAAVLGSFFGIAAIFLIALLLVRYRRNQAKKQLDRQDALDEKRAGSPASSFAPPPGPRNQSPFYNGKQPSISRPTLEPQSQPEDLAPPRKLGQEDTWGPYFANGNNTVENLFAGQSHLAAGAGVGAAAGAGMSTINESRNTQYTMGSEYTIDSPTSSGHHHESATVPPLNVRQSHQAYLEHTRPMSDISPTHLEFEAHRGQGQDTWDPTAANSNGFDPRPASSIYPETRASSIYPPHPLSPTAMSHFPPVPSHPYLTGQEADKGMRSIISTDFGNGAPAANHGGAPFPESAARRVTPGAEPRSAGNASGHGERDLSWLKIGNAN